MVKITHNLLKKCSSKLSLSASNIFDFLQTVTHLYLQEQNIEAIENLDNCCSLVSLYLHENKILKIENLGHLVNLQYIYLQNNSLEKIENLQFLVNLKYLNLARNRIAHVEGLEGLTNLKELWLENQNSSQGLHLTFHDSSLKTMSHTLEVLNVSANGMPSLKELKNLVCLQKLYAENNRISCQQDLVNCISQWKLLIVLKLRGNPVCKARRYKDNVVANCGQLEKLDGKPVLETYRSFLLNWRAASNNKGTGDYSLLLPQNFPASTSHVNEILSAPEAFQEENEELQCNKLKSV